MVWEVYRQNFEIYILKQKNYFDLRFIQLNKNPVDNKHRLK